MISATLAGDAVRGIGHHLCSAQIDGLPQTVYLGRQRAKARPPALRLSAFFDEMGAQPPASVDWYTKAAPTVARMYVNDQLGCCVISSAFHQVGIWSANDPDSGGIILGTDAEIREQYVGICGPGDNGCNIADVLDVARARGMKLGGRYYKIDGYVSIDWTRKELVKWGVALFGSLKLGINLPNEWLNSAVWDVTNSRIVGGHDVPSAGYSDGPRILNTTSDGVVIASWGRLYLITWPAFTSTRWIEECYAVLSPNWYNGDLIAPSGLKLVQLQTALKQLAGGIIPDVPDPNVDPIMNWYA